MQRLTTRVWQCAWVVWSSWPEIADGPAVGEEDEASEVVERFAAVQLSADPTAERFVGEPAQGVERP
jgi:hypothetical protein